MLPKKERVFFPPITLQTVWYIIQSLDSQMVAMADVDRKR